MSDGIRDREPAVNRLFAVIVIAYIAVELLFWGLEAAGVTVRLPLVLNLISGELILILPTVLYLLISRTKVRGICQADRLPLAAVPLLIVMAYCILPFIALVNLGSMMLGGENAASSLAVYADRLPFPVMFFCVAVLPGVAEEFIFRGLFYGTYRRRRGWGAVFLSALLFGLMHMNLNQFCYAFVMGVIFALVCEATGSVLSTMLMHTVYNGNSVILLYTIGGGVTAAGEDSAALLSQMMGSEALRPELVIVILVLAVVALIGMAAAGGLYVALVKLCHRQEQVKSLFCKKAADRHRLLQADDPGEVQLSLRAEQGEQGAGPSCRLRGPALGLGVFLSVACILFRWFVLKLA